MNSQYDEEKWIIEYFNGFIGRFLDIGAHDGVTLSNSVQLGILGWKGVCIEPSCVPFSLLMKHYMFSNKVSVVNCAVDTESRIIEFLDNNGGYASTLDKNFANHMRTKFGSSYHPVFIKTITFSEILDCFGCDFNYITIDTEGNDYEILKTIPFDRLPNLRMLCMEHADIYETDILNFTKEKGFRLLAKTPCNLILVKEK